MRGAERRGNHTFNALSLRAALATWQSDPLGSVERSDGSHLPDPVQGEMVPVIARSGATWQSRGMERQYYIYILTNKKNRVLYTGVTNDLKRRIYEHKTKLTGGFTKSYNVDKLVYYEIVEDAYSAISREKQIKSWKRKNKLELIQNSNPQWQDLYEQL